MTEIINLLANRCAIVFSEFLNAEAELKQIYHTENQDKFDLCAVLNIAGDLQGMAVMRINQTDLKKIKPNDSESKTMYNLADTIKKNLTELDLDVRLSFSEPMVVSGDDFKIKFPFDSNIRSLDVEINGSSKTNFMLGLKKAL